MNINDMSISELVELNVRITTQLNKLVNEPIGVTITAPRIAPPNEKRKNYLINICEELKDLQDQGLYHSHVSDEVGNMYWKHCSHSLDYKVDEDKRTVVCFIKRAGKIVHRAVAKCDPTDVFNEDLGKLIATYRAYDLNVPPSLFEAPQPETIEKGHVVDGIYGGPYEVETTISNHFNGVNKIGLRCLQRLDHPNTNIINDSRAEY